MEHDAVFPFQEFHGNHNYATGGAFKQKRPKRGPRPQSSIKLVPGEVAFRIVCHMSVIGGIIGNSGAIVANLRRETGSKIHCEEAVSGSDHRAILVIGSGSINRRIILSYEEREEREVSCAQEAMIRVFERLWEVEAQNEGDATGGEEAYCGLLADTTQIGAVVGKGGKNIVKMRRDSGAKIRILPPPYFASKDDELIQITGGILAVKKALVAVSGCLQDCPPIERRPVEKARYGASPDSLAEIFPHLSLLLPPLSGNSVNVAANAHSSSTDADKDPSLETNGAQQEVVFRLLCSNGAAGSVIGRKGAIVRVLQNETGASIIFAAPITESGKRVVTISAFENLGSWYSPAQNAVVLVFARSVEADIERGFPSGLSKGTSVTARLLVASDQVDCLDGNRSRIISEIIEVTGADIWMLRRDQVLDCGSEGDVVVQITGEYINVQNALFQVTGRLRDNLLPSEVLKEVRARNPYERVKEPTSLGLHKPLGLSPDSDRETVLMRGMDQLGLSGNRSGPPRPGFQPQQNVGRGQTAAVTNYERNSATFGGAVDLERSLDYLLPTEVLNEVGARSSYGGVTETTSSGLRQSFGLSPGSDRKTILTQRMDQIGLSDNISCPPKLKVPQNVETGHETVIRDSDRSLTTFGGGLELESGKKSAVVRNTTLEVVVAGHVFGSIYGKDGSNLTRLRQISGAKVEVHDPYPGKTEGMVVISGTPDQTRVAQSLLQAFILSGQ